MKAQGIFNIAVGGMMMVGLAGRIVIAQAQVSEEWVARYDGPGNNIDFALSLAIDAIGNVYVTGESLGNLANPDYATIKYNSAGVQQWEARYNGLGDSTDLANSLAVDGAGNVYVTGWSIGSGTAYDYATVKYNSAGVQQWVARYNGPGNDWDEATSLAVDADGNVYVTGRSQGIGTGYDYATIKYNSTGVQQWIERYNGSGTGEDWANALALDNDGNVYITGASAGIGPDYATIKYNSSGSTLWVARYNGPATYSDWATALAVDTDGNVYVTGYSQGIGLDPDYATIKYDSAGVQQWEARYNWLENSWDKANSIAVDAEGNVYVTGESAVDYATIKYDSAGVQQWVARYNGPGNSTDKARSLAVDTDGNVYVTGYCTGNATSYDYCTIKYDSAGNGQWVQRYNGTGNSGDDSHSLAVDAEGNVYVTGQSWGSETASDYTTIKYSQPGAVLPSAPSQQPQIFSFHPPSPNPFNPSTELRYELRAPSLVRLEVFDVTGRLVTVLVDSWQAAGNHRVTFDGSALSSGIYLARLSVLVSSGSGTTPTTATQKLVLLK